MRTVKLTTIPKPDSHEKPYMQPDGAPAVSPTNNRDDADVAYLCGDCDTILAELPFETTLSDALGRTDQLKYLDAEINVLQCPVCNSYNEFPHKNNNPNRSDRSSSNLNDNLKQLIKNSEKIKTEQDFEPEGHFIDPDLHLTSTEDDLYEFSYEELLCLPRYLSDIVLKTSPPRISADHFLYWAWTAAYIAEHPLSDEEDFKKLIREYLSLVQFMLLKRRLLYSYLFYNRDGFGTEINGQRISWSQVWNVIEWENPGIHQVPFLSDRYAATTGFAILDGLINAHSSDLSTKNGELVNEIQSPWHPKRDVLHKGNITYHDKLQTWRHHAASPPTKHTLSMIDDLKRYDPNKLHANMTGLEDIVDTELKSTNHFLRVIARQRNDNLHGQQTTKIIGALVTTLCSLLIWDALSAERFESHREDVLETIRFHGEKTVHDPLSPPAYLPIDRVQSYSDLDVLSPSDPRYPEEYRLFDYE